MPRFLRFAAYGRNSGRKSTSNLWKISASCMKYPRISTEFMQGKSAFAGEWGNFRAEAHNV